MVEQCSNWGHALEIGEIPEAVGKCEGWLDLEEGQGEAGEGWYGEHLAHCQDRQQRVGFWLWYVRVGLKDKIFLDCPQSFHVQVHSEIISNTIKINRISSNWQEYIIRRRMFGGKYRWSSLRRTSKGIIASLIFWFQRKLPAKMPIRSKI